MICERITGWLKRHSTVPGAVVVFAVTYVLVLAINAGVVGAAWVQAVGSVLALIGAIFLPMAHSDRVAKKANSNYFGTNAFDC